MKLVHKIALFTTAIVAAGSVVAETRVYNGMDSSFRIAETAQVIDQTLIVEDDGTFHSQSQSGMIHFTVDTPAQLTYTNADQQEITLVASAPVTIAATVQPARVASR